MIVFLRNIPAKTKRSDIVAFIEPAIKKRWFQKKAEIVEIKVMQLNDPRAGTMEFHGVVTIEPEKVAKKVIRKLNRQVFLGKRIAVHEYCRRNWHNDPRIKNALTTDDRRKSDRRRNDVEIVADISDQFSSNKSFSRRY